MHEAFLYRSELNGVLRMAELVKMGATKDLDCMKIDAKGELLPSATNEAGLYN